MRYRRLPPIHKPLPPREQRAEFASDNFTLLIWTIILIGVAIEVLYNDTIYLLGFMIIVMLANLILRVVDILQSDQEDAPEKFL